MNHILQSFPKVGTRVPEPFVQLWCSLNNVIERYTVIVQQKLDWNFCSLTKASLEKSISVFVFSLQLFSATLHDRNCPVPVLFYCYCYVDPFDRFSFDWITQGTQYLHAYIYIYILCTCKLSKESFKDNLHQRPYIHCLFFLG